MPGLAEKEFIHECDLTPKPVGRRRPLAGNRYSRCEYAGSCAGSQTASAVRKFQTDRHGDGTGRSRRDRARSRCHSRGTGRYDLRRDFRTGQYNCGNRDARRCGVLAVVDDEGLHRHGLHATHRAGQNRSRGRCGEISAGNRQSDGVGGFRRRRPATPASGQAGHQGAAPAHPHLRLYLFDLERCADPLRAGHRNG